MNRVIFELKRFQSWSGLKERLHSHDYRPPLFKEGEIWWCHVGENVGVEINGKSSQYSRPVLVFKKYDRYSFMAIPLSTKEKSGSWYCQFTYKGKLQTAQLSQSRVISVKRLKEKMGQIDDNVFKLIQDSFWNLHNKNRPPL